MACEKVRNKDCISTRSMPHLKVTRSPEGETDLRPTGAEGGDRAGLHEGDTGSGVPYQWRAHLDSRS